MQALKERRRYPRYKVAVTAKLQLSSGELELRSTDICYQGIRLQCPKDDVLKVVPRGAQFTPDEHISIPMQLNLGGEETFEVSGQVMFCHRQSQTIFLLGFNFEKLSADKKTVLKSYLDKLDGVAISPSLFG